MPAGRPKGTKGWDKERQRQKMREQFFEHQDRIIAAQVEAACGLKYLVYRDKKTGKFTPITKEQFDLASAEEQANLEAVEMWEKIPSTPAYVALSDRALDKPTEHVESKSTVEAGPVLERILKGLKRARA